MTADIAAPSVPPASAPPRDTAVDALRGFALFGIILVNVPFFAYPIYEGPLIQTLQDRLVFAALSALAIGKFFLIFSFLFGFGFATTIRADARAGRASGPRFARRLAALAVFGFLHAVFFFVGDILMLYALLGILLWFARDLSPRTLLVLSALAYALAIFAQAAALTAPAIDDGQTLAFAKSGLFPGTPGQRSRPSLAWALLACGLAGSFGSLLVFDVDSPIPAEGAPIGMFVAAMIRSLSALVLSAGFGLLVILAADRSPRALWVTLLAIAGQMTLTGYLFHSVILSFVFGGWGLALYCKVTPLHCLMIGTAAYIGLVLLFLSWRRWFRYGPDEWAMRSWIDLTVKPFRR